MVRLPPRTARIAPPEPPSRPASNLVARIATAVVAVPLLILMVWAGVNSTAALAAAAGALGVYEFSRLATNQPVQPLLVTLAVIAAVLFVVDAAMESTMSTALLAGVIAAPLFFVVFFPPYLRTPSHWAWMLAGALLIGWTLSLAVLLRQQDQGREWSLFLLVVTFGVDTGAFFAGRSLGKNKLAPTISPGKTWEGLAGGVATGAIAAMASSSGFGIDVSLWLVAMVGVLVAIASQLGDLAESMIKRTAGVKDAGNLFPGHGGILDRLDSLIPAIIVVYLVTEYLGR